MSSLTATPPPACTAEMALAAEAAPSVAAAAPILARIATWVTEGEEQCHIALTAAAHSLAHPMRACEDTLVTRHLYVCRVRGDAVLPNVLE